MIEDLINSAEKELKEEFNKIDELEYFYSKKVLDAFKKNNVSEACFNSTTGYGYNDLGRDTLEHIYSDIFNSEDALVRNQFISGSHALSVTLFALLRPGDTLLSVSGLPYDTLHEVIGITDNKSSLKSFNINYEQIDLVSDDFDYDKIKEYLTNNKVKVIAIQRSKGYSERKSINIQKLDKVIKLIKKVSSNTIVMIDNCYCEFTEEKNPIEVGADIVVGSLIKNLGGGIAPNGAYVVGKHDLIELVGERLTLPGEGREVGPTLNINKKLYQGLFLAPSVVASALKVAKLSSYVLEKLGYNVSPKYNEEQVDIVLTIVFGDKDKLIKYCQGIQSASPIDSNVLPIPWDMPGYKDQVIMAAGTFTQGSSIELSCDGPLRKPYIANISSTILGIIYCGWLPGHIILLRNLGVEQADVLNFNDTIGLGLSVFLLLTCVATDVGGWYFGCNYGKTPLCPEISPKKTIEGAVYGTTFAVIIATITGLFLPIPLWCSVLGGLLISIFAQFGDLSESLLKRDAGMKDSGQLLPGHGGFLDRVDSYIFAAPIAYYYFKFFVLAHQPLVKPILSFEIIKSFFGI